MSVPQRASVRAPIRSLLGGWSTICVFAWVCALLFAPGAWAHEKPPARNADAQQQTADTPRPWIISHGSTNNHPRLHDAQRQIDAKINRPLRLLVPSSDDVRSFSDQRDDFMIWTPFLSIGRVVSPRWEVFAQTGYTAGKVHSKDTAPSVLLLPLHSDVHFKRSSFYIGVGAAFFPWGMPELREYTTLLERLENAKPFFVTSINYNYLTADTDVRMGLKPFGNAVHIRQEDRWRTWNSAILAGVEIPLGTRTSLSVNAGYNVFFRYADDFGGPSATIQWRWRF